ncbi:hypothetical protein AB0B31_25825 [Catellatospora citrea]|uniref:hypothetical protein n=1 Tax=Catellatospora citrea TaxID=53366 RepID=UPI0033E2A74C
MQLPAAREAQPEQDRPTRSPPCACATARERTPWRRRPGRHTNGLTLGWDVNIDYIRGGELTADAVVAAWDATTLHGLDTDDGHTLWETRVDVVLHRWVLGIDYVDDNGAAQRLFLDRLGRRYLDASAVPADGWLSLTGPAPKHGVEWPVSVK